MNELRAEVGLIHGSGFIFNGDSYAMSTGSRLNAEKAAELMDANLLDKVICSGRGPVQGESYGTSEAQLMADYLVSAGFDHNRIEVEANSTSAIGNWVNSARILTDIEAASVMGVAAKVNIQRMQLIGEFVAKRCNFDIVGYSPSKMEARAKDYLRESINYQLTRRFLRGNTFTPVYELDDAYESYKAQIGLASLKRFVHRKAAVSSPSQS